ncbi:hypothetical protein L6452_39551 [Arctium lappa]|uniref:Uncharacterized protein n=1 Tax=Arctium lappa TaxID=4217 RepID=A0ACB8XRZ1_ARCLA|nr:hypothetical protein L6452_39551 [Arctium lappa]
MKSHRQVIDVMTRGEVERFWATIFDCNTFVGRFIELAVIICRREFGSDYRLPELHTFRSSPLITRNICKSVSTRSVAASICFSYTRNSSERGRKALSSTYLILNT